MKQNYSFRVEMFFQDKNGRNIMKEATRCLPQKKFTSETKNKIMEETVFEINRPSGKNLSRGISCPCVLIN